MYSMFQSGIDSPLFNMSRVISTKTEQRFPNMVSQLEGGLCGFRHSGNVTKREVGILIMLFDKETSHRE